MLNFLHLQFIGRFESIRFQRRICCIAPFPFEGKEPFDLIVIILLFCIASFWLGSPRESRIFCLFTSHSNKGCPNSGKKDYENCSTGTGAYSNNFYFYPLVSVIGQIPAPDLSKAPSKHESCPYVYALFQKHPDYFPYRCFLPIRLSIQKNLCLWVTKTYV